MRLRTVSAAASVGRTTPTQILRRWIVPSDNQTRWLGARNACSLDAVIEDLRVDIEELLRHPKPRREMSALRSARPELLEALASEAVRSPDASVRRGCLDYLDHVPGIESAAVFVAALQDPVPRIRRHAIHALTCEVCTNEPVCIDVVTPLRRCVAADPNPKVRFEALRQYRRPILDRYPAAGDVGAWEAGESSPLSVPLRSPRRRVL
jgi:hypothetical protein